MTGLKEAIRSLNKIEPGLRKEFTAQATRIAQPAIQEAQRGYQREYLSGMARKWTQNGKKIFPFSVAKAVSGVKLKVDASREAVSLIYITQTNVGAAVFEAAGRQMQTASVTHSGNYAQAQLEFSAPPCFASAEKLKEKCNQHLKR